MFVHIKSKNSLPQLIIGIVFLFNQINNNGFNDIIIWANIITCWRKKMKLLIMN